MKHVLIACVVFALCLAVGLVSLFYVRASGAQTNELLERSIRQAETEDYTGAAASLRQAKQVWEGRERILGIFLHHEEVDEVIALFAQLEQFIRLEALFSQKRPPYGKILFQDKVSIAYSRLNFHRKKKKCVMQTRFLSEFQKNSVLRKTRVHGIIKPYYIPL